jgi:hypothetical protein
MDGGLQCLRRQVPQRDCPRQRRLASRWHFRCAGPGSYGSKASQKKAPPKAKLGEKPAAAKTAPKQAKPAAKARKPEARDGSKKSAVIELLRRKEGATPTEITKITKGQPHTIRGFISGTISKKMKLAVESVRNEQGERSTR